MVTFHHHHNFSNTFRLYRVWELLHQKSVWKCFLTTYLDYCEKITQLYLMQAILGTEHNFLIFFCRRLILSSQYYILETMSIIYDVFSKKNGNFFENTHLFLYIICYSSRSNPHQIFFTYFSTLLDRQSTSHVCSLNEDRESSLQIWKNKNYAWNHVR